MYFILEIQSQGDGRAAIVTPIRSAENLNAANSQYHQVLAAAAVSSVPYHSAVMIGDMGDVLKSECYVHTPEPAPEPAPEPEGENEG